MKIINKHIYADITEKTVETQYTFKSDPHYETMIGYQVVFTTEYDLVIFGKAFHKVKTIVVPFLFKTIEIAKDFCEVKPNYSFYRFINNEWEVQYYTYKLTSSKDKELIGYIWWNRDSVIITDENCKMVFDFDKNPIIDGFIKTMELPKWMNTHGLNNIKYYGFENFISKLVTTKQEEVEEKHWRYELIEH